VTLVLAPRIDAPAGEAPAARSFVFGRRGCKHVDKGCTEGYLDRSQVAASDSAESVGFEVSLMPKREMQKRDNDGRTIDKSSQLVKFAKQKQLDGVKELLRSESASFSARALIEGFFACLSVKRDIEMVELFLSRGFDPNVDLPRFTPLGAAAMSGDTELIKVMIAHGCEVKRAAGNGDTPLLSCCKRGSENCNPHVRAACLEVARLLIELGADVDCVNHEGNTPLDCACAAISPGWSEMITLLLDSNARFDRCRNHGANCVMHVAMTLSDEPLKALLEHGVDPNSRDVSGITCLMYAASFARVERAKLLLERGARVLLRDPSGKTAFDYAYECPGRAEFIALLEQAAKLEEPDAQDLETAGRFVVDASSSPQNAADSKVASPSGSRSKAGAFKDIVGTYRLDPDYSAMLAAKFFHDRFEMKPGYDEAMKDYMSTAAGTPEIEGIRLIVDERQITLRAADGSEATYRITKTWKTRGRRFIETDSDGMAVRFEVKRHGVSSLQLECDYVELGDFAWVPE
jgi:ankyrin repeat protein